MKHKWEFLADLIQWHRPQINRVFDIGISKGATVRGIKTIFDSLLIPKPIDEYYGVDPYLDPYYAASASEKRFLATWIPFKLVQLTSDEFFADMSLIDKKADLIFIDGSHIPEQMCKDIKNYSSLVSDGGILAGHDYNSVLHNQYGDYTKITKFIDNEVGAQNINIEQDARLEGGQPTYLWWTYKREGKWSKV